MSYITANVFFSRHSVASASKTMANLRFSGKNHDQEFYLEFRVPITRKNLTSTGDDVARAYPLYLRDCAFV